MRKGRSDRCQICGDDMKILTHHNPNAEWVSITFHCTLGDFSVTACTPCSDLPPERLLQCYQSRISSGKDLNFH